MDNRPGNPTAAPRVRARRIHPDPNSIPHYSFESADLFECADLLARDLAPHVCTKSAEDLVVRSIRQFAGSMVETEGVSAFAFCSSHEDPFPSTLSILVCLDRASKLNEAEIMDRVNALDATLAEQIGFFLPGELQYLDPSDNTIEELTATVLEYCAENCLQGLALVTPIGE